MWDMAWRACIRVECSGSFTRCERRTGECLDIPSRINREVCVDMPTKIEALAALDDLVSGYCSVSGLGDCSCEAKGKESVKRSLPFSAILRGIWNGIASWAESFTASSKLLSREHPNPPARQR